MNINDRIYIPPRRQRLGLDVPPYKLRHFGYVLLACAAVSGLIWWRLS